MKETDAVVTLVVAFLAFAAFLFWFGMDARAHDALPTAAQPYGWSYPVSCCSGHDCSMIKAKTVKEGPEGYTITLTPDDHPMVAQTTTWQIEYSNKKIQDSPDGDFHICISRQFETPDKSATMGGNFLCLFVPPRSF